MENLRKRYLNKAFVYLSLALFITAFYACNFEHPDAREINFLPEMQAVADKHKKTLHPDKFLVNSAWSVVDTIETHWVVVSLLNAKNLPNESIEVERLAKNIAKDTYSQLINKHDFTHIEVVFKDIVDDDSFITTQYVKNFHFSFDELSAPQDSVEY